MQPLRERNWKLKESCDDAVEGLIKGGIASLLARLLANRMNCDNMSAAMFFSSNLSQLHDPFLMMGMEPAVDRLVEAVTNGESLHPWRL